MRRVTLRKVQLFFDRSPRGMVRTIREWIRGSFDATLTFTTFGPCPLRCNCCPWEVYRDSSVKLNTQVMTFEMFKRMLATVPKSVVINFGGFTESVLAPDMPLMAKYAYGKGHPIELFTTLVGLSDEGAEILSKIHFDKLCIHVPDDQNTLFDAEKWLKLLAKFKGKRLKGITFGALGKVDPRITAVIGELPFFESHVFNKKQYYENQALPSTTGKLQCMFNHTGLNIDQNCVAQNGDVAICSQDYELKNIMGNLLTQTYQQVMDSPVRKEFIRRMQTDDEPVLCRRCPHGSAATDKSVDPRYEHKWKKA